jgi:hypothetical protein
MTKMNANITMRNQLRAQLGESARTRAANEHEPTAVTEPTLRDRLQALMPGFDADALDILTESERARVGGNGEVEVLTLHGWYPANGWAIRQALDIAPPRTVPTAATYESVARHLVDRRRSSKPSESDE